MKRVLWAVALTACASPGASDGTQQTIPEGFVLVQDSEPTQAGVDLRAWLRDSENRFGWGGQAGSFLFSPRPDGEQYARYLMPTRDRGTIEMWVRRGGQVSFVYTANPGQPRLEVCNPDTC